MDDAPMLRTDKGKADTTARHVLQVLAEHARPDGSNAHPSVLRIQYRAGYDRATVQRALRRLEKGGLIKKDGSVDGRTRYRLAMDLRRPPTDWKQLEIEAEAERSAAAERKRRSRAKHVTHAESVTVTHGESVTNDVTHSKSGRHASEVRDVTHSKSGRHALNAAQTTNQPPEQPPTTKDSSSAPVSQAEEDLTEFGNFWLLHPKSRDRERTLAEWRIAVASGVDPKKITAAAKAYAREQAGQPIKYIKTSANWIRDGRYNDVFPPEPEPGRPHLRAVAGEYQPYRNPVNQDVYDEDL
jgi:DNA-binding transcriptional ArsR family regulator